MWFFVFSINFARTREGRPARKKLTELLVKSKKTLVTEPAAIFFVFQVNISCKTTSIILYFKYASFSVVTRKKRQNTNPHPDGNFFDVRFGLGILRDVSSCESKAYTGFKTSQLSVVFTTHWSRSVRLFSSSSKSAASVITGMIFFVFPSSFCSSNLWFWYIYSVILVRCTSGPCYNPMPSRPSLFAFYQLLVLP